MSTSSPLGAVTDTVSDAWSKRGIVADVASTAAELAADVAVAAVERLPDLPERAAGLATAARGRIAPQPRRSRKPLVLLAAGIAAFVVVAFVLKRRAASSSSDDFRVDGAATAAG